MNKNLSNIKTYDWASNIDQIPDAKIFAGPNGVYIFNNASGRKKIKDAIQYQFDERGYNLDPASPDMYVTFYMLEQPDSLITSHGYVTLNTGEKVLTDKNVSSTYAEAGTLIVNFIDAKSGAVMWQGFASGILQPDMMNNDKKIKEAVSTVFNEFKYNNVS